MELRARYRVALLDWLALAPPGADEARATRSPGLAHLSAPTGPAALVLGAALDRSVGDALAAYADGFEAMGALAAANHPTLYERGWHPTAVWGSLGAAVAAIRLLGLDLERERSARALALMRAGGMRAG